MLGGEDSGSDDRLMIRLATWNLENFGERHGAAPLEARCTALRPPLVALGADILCLQEVDSQRPRPRAARSFAALGGLLRGTPYEGYAQVASKRPDGRGPADIHNLVILSRFGFEGADSICHRFTPRQHLELRGFGGIDIGFDRPILHARVRLPEGRLLHVVNVHLRAPLASLAPAMHSRAEGWTQASLWAEGYFLSAVKRMAQALEVRHLVDRLQAEDPGALIAVCGDFNARALEMPVRLVTAAAVDTESPALEPAALLPLADRLAADRRFSVRFRGEPMLVDHILASATLAQACRGVDIANDGLLDETEAEAQGSAFAGSTHAAVVAAFALPQVP